MQIMPKSVMDHQTAQLRRLADAARTAATGVVQSTGQKPVVTKVIAAGEDVLIKSK